MAILSQNCVSFIFSFVCFALVFLLARLGCNWQEVVRIQPQKITISWWIYFGEENVEIGHSVRDRETVKSLTTSVIGSGEICRPLSSKMKCDIKLAEAHTKIGVCLVWSQNVSQQTSNFFGHRWFSFLLDWQVNGLCSLENFTQENQNYYLNWKINWNIYISDTKQLIFFKHAIFHMFLIHICWIKSGDVSNN